MSGSPLQGINVVEFTWFIAGPMVGRYLADHGATVVRVETAARLDPLRTSPPFAGSNPGVNRSGYFACYNSGKYGVTLNLNRPGGVELARRLVRWSDVVVENFRPGTVEKWGLGYEQLRRCNPSVIMLSTSMFGRDTPVSDQPGLGPQLTALTGFTHLTGWPDRGPANPYGAYTDTLVARLAATAVVAALSFRRRTGKGQYLDLSQYEAAQVFLAPVLLDYSLNGRVQSRRGNRSPSAAPHGVYPCRGVDRWCAIAVASDAEWDALCQAMGNPKWAQDSKFATLLGRKRQEDQLDKQLACWTVLRSPEEVVARLQAVGVAAGTVATCQDLFSDPQLVWRQHFVPLEHPDMGIYNCEGVCFHLSETPGAPRTPAPCLGEHNETVYMGFLGLSQDEVAELVAQGVIEFA